MLIARRGNHRRRDHDEMDFVIVIGINKNRIDELGTSFSSFHEWTLIIGRSYRSEFPPVPSSFHINIYQQSYYASSDNTLVASPFPNKTV